MSVYDFIKTKLGDWIEVDDGLNEITIKDFSYETGVIGPITKKHCAKCIAVNKCWFKNETDKKPEASNIIFDIASPLFGLYHPGCHCREIFMVAPTMEEIKIIIPEGKIGWLFRDKPEWLNVWWYTAGNEILQEIYRAVKEAYINGDYKVRSHSNYGFQVTLFVTINGANQKQGRKYNLKSGFTIFPHGQLKCNTLIGGKW